MHIRITVIILLVSLIAFSCGGSRDRQDLTGSSVEMQVFCLENPPFICKFNGIDIYEGGISGMTYIEGTDMEFYLVNDRGPNLVMTSHHHAMGENVKVLPFPDYAPKIFRTKLENGRYTVTEAMPLRRPDGGTVSGLPFPVNLDMNREIAWKDLNATPAGEDPWGIDAEGIVTGHDNDFWIVVEYRTSIWNVDKESGITKGVYGPELFNEYYRPIDTVFKYRRPNRGFESVAITPGGLVYAILQSPMWFPGPEVSETSRLVRMLELDPSTGETRMFFYEHSDARENIRIRDWKIADMVAVNNSEFLVIEHATMGESQFMDIYRIDISNATPIEREDYGGKTPELLNDAAGAMEYGIRVVDKTHLLDLIAAGYDPVLDKPEGIAIIDNKTIAIINDNDYDIDAPENNEYIIQPDHPTCLFLFRLPDGIK